jgi:L-ascorbate metabolism protein UlaG (beta-lactamase superfamily)
MKITRFEQSGFIFETEKGFRFGFDIAVRTPIEKLEGVAPLDAFWVSHIHPDHLSVPHIQRLAPKKLYLNSECIEAIGESEIVSEVVTVRSGDTLQIDDFHMQIFDVDHGPNVREPVKENHAFLMEIDGEKVYFAGDMFYESGIDVSNLEVDLALLPVGTFYTFGPEEALAFAKKFKQIGKVVSMHERGEHEHIEKFLQLAAGVINAE